MSPLDPRDAVMKKVHLAFLAYGYEQMTMIGLAKAADMSRRSLYNYFANKEEAFRAAVRWGNARNIASGQMAAAEAKAAGADALEILVAFADARYGGTRRELGKSPHAVEINDQAFRRCRDIMIDAAVAGQDRLADILLDLQEAGLVRWRENYSAAQLAQYFSDAARGVNQTLPPRPSISLRERYREIFAALLGGVTQA
ncbi:MAG TPA: helix-turn-helix domain-containing protein [Acidocella sp.]|jgi:AcrR family transcriptional regulator|nr:helix-turn-helix domain-containing protein [Acidocella sp.]